MLISVDEPGRNLYLALKSNQAFTQTFFGNRQMLNCLMRRICGRNWCIRNDNRNNSVLLPIETIYLADYDS